MNQLVPQAWRERKPAVDKLSAKAKFATGLTVSELKRLRSLEDENRRLKQIVAQQALDNWALKELLAKTTSEAQGEEDGDVVRYRGSWAE